MLDKLAGNTYVHVAALVLLALLAYSNTFDVPFLYDDIRFIKDNPLIKDFGYFTNPSSTEDMHVSEDVKRYFKSRYVGNLSLWANYKLGGLDVRGFHVVNLALHIINSLLVYLLVVLTFRTPLLDGSKLKGRSGAMALLAGLLFAVHPLQTEAVTYILQRFVLVAAMFYLLSSAAYAGARLSTGRAKRYGLYALAILTAILGMKTKENVFTLPLMIALYEVIFFRDSLKKRLLYLFPFLATMLIIPLTYAKRYAAGGGLAGAMSQATWLEGGVSRSDYFLTQLSVIVSYIKLIFIPVGQTVDHDHPVYRSFFEPAVLVSLLLLLCLFAIGVYVLRRSLKGEAAGRLLAFGIFWFFVAISVESSVLPIGEIMVEYRVYLPSAGMFMAAAVLVFSLLGRISIRWANAALLAMTCILILMFAGVTHARNEVWESKKSLWSDAVRKSPLRPRGYINLGTASLDEKRYDEAIRYLETALRLKEPYSEKHPKNDAHYNLGLAYYAKDMLREAIIHYEAAIKMAPFDEEARYNLAIAYNDAGMKGRAIEQYLEALKIKPSSTKIRYNLALTYLTQGRMEQARRELEEVLRREPWHRRARKFLEYVNNKQTR
jgi:tetratricopeptide (TPR) repeat protein